MVLGVEHIVLDTLGLQHLGQLFGFLNGNSTYQHGLLLLMALLHLTDNGAHFSGLGLVDYILMILTGNGTVGGNLHNVQLVDGAELLHLGHGSTGHTGELVIQTEVVLEGDGSQSLGLMSHVDFFLGLDSLMQTLVVAAAEHQSSGELVHDDDLAVLDDIVNIPLHYASGLQSLIDVVGNGGILRIGQIFQIEGLFSLTDAAGSQGGSFGFLIHDIVGVNIDILFFFVIHAADALAYQSGNKLVGNGVQLAGLLTLTGDDQGGTSLIDEDGVHLVDDGEGVTALHQLLGVDGHVVAQIVETKFVVGTVGDIGIIGSLLLGTHYAMDYQTYGQTQETIDLAHPLAVALGQIVVYGNDMNTASGQSVQVSGQGSHQGLAFTGTHLGNTALMQYDAAHDLYAIVTQTQHAPCGFTAGGKCLGENIVQSFALCQTLLELRGLGLELSIRQLFVFLFQCIHLVHDGVNGF